MTLSLKLFGQFEIRDSTGAAQALPTRKTRALLGYLALNADQPQLRERLMALLWSDRGDKQARQSLNHALRAIRKLSEEAGIPLIDGDGERVTLRGDAVQSDAARFRELLGDRPGEAAALYTGPLLDGLSAQDPVFEDWLLATRAEYHKLACDALEAAAASDDGGSAIDLLQRLLVLDPLREDAHRQLMRLLHQSGDRVGALRQYKTCANILSQELQVEPDALTRALYEKLKHDSGTESPPVSLEPSDNSRADVSPNIQQVERQKIPVTSVLLLVLAAIVLLVIGGGFTFWFTTQAPPPDSANDVTPSLSSPDKPSVAVLPFVNMSGDKEQEYFSDGMTEDLITDLSRISGLTVISRTSTFAYKGQSADIRSVGQELGVRYVVEGSVRMIGDRVRITTQLVDAESGNHIWAERFDRAIADIFTLQDEVRGKIVSALKIKLTAQEEQWLTHRLTKSPEAYDLYLRGLQQESYYTQEGNLESQRLFQKAIEVDPDFAAAYAQLAQAYSLAQENGWTDKRQEFANKALAHAKKAVELDDELPGAHWSLARVYTRAPLRDHERAIATLKRVIRLDPNNADGYAFLAATLIYVGRAPEALGLLEQAMRINPRFPFWYLHTLGQSQYLMTRYEAAAESFKRATERNPTVPWPRLWLLASYGQLGMKEEAEWEISELENLNQSISIKGSSKTIPLSHPAYLKQLQDGLRNAGLPEE